MVNNRNILVQNIQISVSTVNNDDFISLTDMVSGFEGGSSLIESWLRNKDTVEFLGVWERINNSILIPSNSRELEIKLVPIVLPCQPSVGLIR